MIKRIKKSLNDMSLGLKLRASYLIMAVPLICLLLYSFHALSESTSQYNEMINSAIAAGDFSLDFKDDFDYETYLLIVGNKSVEEAELDELLAEANGVIDELEEITTLEENQNRLKSVRKYLGNLEKYKERIENNLSDYDGYEKNIEIWENDVQIVTALIKEEVFNYIYYEIRQMQAAHAITANYYESVIRVCTILGVLIGVFVIICAITLPMSITRPIQKLVDVTKEVSAGNLSVRSDIKTGDEVGVLSESFDQMIDKINELLSQITKEQVRIRKAELELLQSQINPHFLYNTLDTIVWLAEGGYQEEVVGMVTSLSAFFRTSISRGKEMITIEEELVHAGSYLKIQQYRYQDILTYDISVGEEFNKYMIPKITLQPLIENALYHGIKNKRGGGKISVYAKRLGDDFAVYIRDDGIGMSSERLKEVMDGMRNKKPSENDIYGLYNVNERIRLKFGDEYGITIDSVSGEGTNTKILLPCITEEKIQPSE